MPLLPHIVAVAQDRHTANYGLMRKQCGHWHQSPMADDQPGAFRTCTQQRPAIRQHSEMGANAGSVQVNSLRSDLLVIESPLERFYVTFDTPAKPSRRRQ
jgi:hypothetical protein